MTKLKLSIIIDFLFRNTLIFLLIYAWTIFYLNDWIIALIVAALASLLICFALDKIKGARTERKKLSIKEREQSEAISLQLLFSTEAESLEYFTRLLSQTHQVSVVNKTITYTDNNQKTVWVPCYQDAQLTHLQLSDAVKHAKQKKADQLVIVCPTCSPEMLKLASNIKDVNTTVLNQAQLYHTYIKPANILPTEKIALKGATRLTIKDLISYAFSGKRTKSFAYLGLILILCSFFVVFKLYYLIMGSILLVFAIASHINGRRNASTLS